VLPYAALFYPLPAQSSTEIAVHTQLPLVIGWRGMVAMTRDYYSPPPPEAMSHLIDSSTMCVGSRLTGGVIIFLPQVLKLFAAKTREINGLLITLSRERGAASSY
jgi:hypothetical protein